MDCCEQAKSSDNRVYRCKECGLHYKERTLAEKCEAWCKEHHSCNLEIIKDSVEEKKKTGKYE